MTQPRHHAAGSPLTSTTPLTPLTPVREPAEPRPLPPYNVLLHNDPINDQHYVTVTICELTALKWSDARHRMNEAHYRGVSLLLTTHKERAELYAEQFRSKGLTVTIEPTGSG